jgi:Glycosyl hydrolase family 12
LNVASKSHVFLALIVSLVTLGLCAAIPSPERSKWVCNQDPPVAVYDDTYNVHSNRYGSAARECISVRGTSFTVADSSLSNSPRNRPGGYPSIYKGCHWGSCTKNSGLPVRVDQLNSARSDWNTSLDAGGTYNVAYDLWFHSGEFASEQADAAELMIWLRTRGGVQPFGSRVGQTVIGDATYSVWYGRQKSHHGKSNYIAYTDLAGSGSASNLDVKAFIDDAVARGYIQPGWYLISIQAGFEIWKGGEGLATNSFAATVNNPLGSAPLNIWWPRDGSVISGKQPFQARLQGHDLDSYDMFWSVDGGQLNEMYRGGSESDRKEAPVDLKEWTWRKDGDRYGPFLVTFTAKDPQGTIVRQKTITIYVTK